MKRFSSAVVAIATAATLTAVPAIAQESSTPAPATTATPASTTAGKATTTIPAATLVPATTATTATKPTTTKPSTPANNSKNSKKEGSSTGSSRSNAVAWVSALSGALLTTSLIVLADPRGLNMIIDALNREFSLGIPNVYVPTFDLPNFNLPF